IMPSYSSWNGVKCSGSKRLLTEILKDELGFEGFLISDYAAIEALPGNYKAQVAGSGAVSGLVRDPYGDGLPDTSVILNNPSLGIRRAMTTTDDGVFHVPALPAATGYNLKISRKGFIGWESKFFEVSVGETVDIRVTLQTDPPTEQVRTAPVQRSEAASGRSTLVSRDEIDNLPIVARAWTSGLLLAPGVTVAGGLPAVRGVLDDEAFYIDGVDIASSYYLAKQNASRQFALDGVHELQTITAVAPAEFGGAGGGFVNAVTSGGSNQFHGDIYDYFRNQSLNAPDRYAEGWNPEQRQNQFGASLGGPAWKDKLFFFANLEGLSYRGAGLNRITNPMIADATGDHVAAANCTASAAQCTAAAKFIQSQMNVVVPRSIHSDTGLVKIDFRPNERNTFSVSADAMGRRAPDGIRSGLVVPDGSLLGNNGDLKEQSRFAKASWTRMLGTNMFNNLRVAWSRDRLSENADPSLWPSTGMLAINVAGTWLGGSPAYPFTLNEEKRRVADSFTFSSLSHTVQVGAEWTGMRDNADQLYARAGMYTYPTLTLFASDFSGITAQRKNYTMYNQALVDGGRHYRPSIRSYYAQDTYKIISRLTVNFGVRWEKTYMPQPTNVNTAYYQTGTIPQSNTDAAPHAGVAFRAADRTVLRFGYGWYYTPYAGELLDSLLRGAQSYVSVVGSLTTAPIFPNVIGGPKGIPPGSEDLIWSAGKLRNPYTKQAVFSIEQQIRPGATLTLSLVHSPGIKLWTSQDQNLTAPTKTVTYTINDASNKAASKFSTPYWTSKSDPRYAQLFQVENLATSKYDGVTLELRKQMSHGLSVDASYTWSHAIDNMGANPLIGLGAVNLYPGDNNSDRGDAAADQRHRA
ncbi:MAG: TonB-dependent receptor, partial [Acidobacteriia bacterium]|nr:TonB-dependent receptor [Terriglobia bacterium]